MKHYSPSKRIPRGPFWLAAACLLALVAGPAARAAGATQLQSIDVQPLTGQHLQVTLHLSGPAPKPLGFTISNPPRIALDLPGTTLALPSRRIDVGTSGLDTILAAEAKDRSRVVFDLDKLVSYSTKVSGDDIIVTLGVGPARALPAKAVQGPEAQSPIAQAAASQDTSSNGGAAADDTLRAISSIDFHRGAGGTGRVIVKLTDPRTPINLRQIGNQIIVDFTGAELPKNLMRRYDATDFGTPITSFEALRTDNHSSRIVIHAAGDYQQLAYQSDDKYVVEVQPVSKAQAAKQEKPKYTGERLTLNFQDIKTRAVLQLLADASGQNIVVSDAVTGSVTLRLQNVPWDQALDIILKTKGLGKIRQGNVIIVAPAAQLAAREKAELAAQQDLQQLAPIRSVYLQINYAKAADIAALIKSQGNSLLSSRGSVAVDERTNTLLLQDTADRITAIRRLVAKLDIPVRQVLIESRIVVVNDDFTRQLGVRAGFNNRHSNGANGASIVGGSAAATDTALTNVLSGGAFGNGVPTGSDAANRYNVNLPVTNPAGQIAYMLLGSNYLVDLELSAAQAEDKARIISSPHVITANQKEATIEQGVEIPYQEAASSGATTVQFKKAVLSLKVTPQITPDNRIILDLDVKKDSAGTTFVGSGGVNVPIINTREITTQVLVNDGQTVVLGGILDTQQSNTETKVPLLGDIPVLGHLFKSTKKVNNKDELLIFVTPKILHEGVTVY